MWKSGDQPSAIVDNFGNLSIFAFFCFFTGLNYGRSSFYLCGSMSTEPETSKVQNDDSTVENSSTPSSSAPSSEPAAESAKPKRKILIGSQLGEDKTNRPATTETSVAPLAATKTEATISGVELANQNIESAIHLGADTADHLSAGTADHLSADIAESAQPTAISETDELESQLDNIMGGVSMDQLIEGQSVEEELELESRVKATVQKIHNENVFFILKGRFEGIASIRNFKTPPEPGAMLDVLIKSKSDEDGLYEVSVPGSSVTVADWSDLTQGAIVEVKVTGSNTGGLECVINSIRGFIPASQIEIFRVDNFGDYVNKKMTCVVQEVNPSKKKLVLSHRAIAEREKEEKKKELLATLEVGETRDGTVTKLMDFGAFVDIGGTEGLVHISKLAWERVEHPSAVVKEGESVSVKIEKIDQQTGKIGLSMRDTQEHPWKKVDQEFPVDSVAKGTVSKLAQFGAFVKLSPGVEGLVHISEIAHHRVMSVSTHLSVGDEVEVKIISVDSEAQKIGLSLKALQAKPEKADSAKKDEPVDEPLRESAVKKTDEPLKGGTQGKTGGESFGLNW